MTKPTEVSSQVDATPVPVRYWWLKRLGAAGVLLVLALVGLRIWWGYVAEARLQAKIAEYRAAGEPIAVEDFAPPAVADAENGASFLTAAAKDLGDSGRGRELLDYAWEGRWRRDYLTELRNFVDETQPVLGLLHAASLCQQADWKIPLSLPVPNLGPPNGDAQRELTGRACLAILVFHEAGEDGQAVATLCDILAQARHIGRMTPTVLAHMMGIAAERQALCVAESIAGTLRIAAAPESAARGAVESLIRNLLDRRELDEGWRWCLYGERWGQLESVLTVVGGQTPVLPPSGAVAAVGDCVTRPLLGPAWKLDAVRMLEGMTAAIEAGTAENWPVARGMLPPDERGVQNDLLAIVRFMSNVLLPALEPVTEHEFRRLAHRRMAAAALAIRLYELDHGRRPAELDDLVPEYLGSVPRDPFDAGNGALRYAPDATPARLYSVGLDGVDDGGDFVLVYGSVDERVCDLVFFLDGERPCGGPSVEAPFPAASEEAVRDGADVEEDEGEQNGAE